MDKSIRKCIDTILCEAIEMESAADRQAYLDNVCGHDAELRRQAEMLIANHFEAGDFLEEPVVAVLAAKRDELFVDLDRLDRDCGHRRSVPTEAKGPSANLEEIGVTEPISADAVGTVIDGYKLLQKIGEGGMGVVYMADQSHPVSRRVALKIVKPGMDTKEVLARFEAERQALALMDHPNIARVLDAGTTRTGRPYFVMELVKGISITTYCDENHLSPIERLELFLPVCQAVQHAHQKGIIHRDIKPSNVLVAQYDGHPVPKIIDFGLAKAIGQRLTEKTMFTQYGQIVGTIDYMSPEQASFNQLDVDTRSDIYSLGVLLYELLAGETPFDRKRLRSAAIEELLRIIRQEEPPRPSVRLSSHARLPTIAANRTTEPKKLCLLVRGDLDWIVMKALEKNRTRRYETASEFAHDIRRYLTDDVVHACPPSAVYRLQKFARRHRTLLASGLAVLVTLLLGLVATSMALISANKARDIATSKQREAEHAAMQLYLDARDNYERVRKLREFRESTVALLDRITNDVGNDATVDRTLRKNLLESVIALWSDTIEFEQDPSEEPSFQTQLYHLRRAVCLARLGEHRPAFQDTHPLRLQTERTGAWSGDILRVCALCAASAEDDQACADSYIKSGIEYASAAADHADVEPPPSDDPDLEALTSNEEFQAILQRWRMNLRKKGEIRQSQ